VEGASFCTSCGAYLEWTGQRQPQAQRSAVSAVVAPETLAVEPGGQAALTLQVTNRGTIVDRFRVTVWGSPASWTSVEPAELSLFPGAAGDLQVLLRPPRSPGLPAGPAEVRLRVSSQVDPTAQAEQAIRVMVGAFQQLNASLHPETSESVDEAEHIVTVQNLGNQVVTVGLSAQDPDDALRVDLQPAQLTIEPGQSQAARLRVGPRRALDARPGQPRRFDVLLQAAGAPPTWLGGAAIFTPPPPPVAEPARRRRVWPAVVALLAIAGLVLGATSAAAGHFPPWAGSGTSVSLGSLQVSAPAVSFGTVQVGRGAGPTTVAVSNGGAGATTVAASLGGTNAGEFHLQDGCQGVRLARGQGCQLQVSFAPASQGSKSATVTFAPDNAPALSPLALTGDARGVAVVQFAPAAVSISLFGTTAAPPTTGTVQLTVTNNGTGDLTIQRLQLDDASGRFSLTRGCDGMVLRPRGSCQSTVTYSSTSFGQVSASILVFDDAPGSPQGIPLTGSRCSIACLVIRLPVRSP